MEGHKLIDQITLATGLPNDLINQELEKLILSRGLKKEQISLEDIRSLLAEYLQEVLLSAKKEMQASGLD